MKTNHTNRPIAGLAIAGLLTFVGAATAVAADTTPPAAATVKGGPGSLDGIWYNSQYKWTGGFPAEQRSVHTVDGETPPLQQWALDERKARIAASDGGKPFVNTTTQCLPSGVPNMMYGADWYPIQFIETQNLVVMLFVEQNHFRRIRLNSQHLADPDPSYMGDSIGHWEGDTLVVDTIGLMDKTTLDMVGTPHSDKLHVVERLRRTAPDTVEDLITLEDPGAFTKTWQTKAVLKTAPAKLSMNEYICELGNK